VNEQWRRFLVALDWVTDGVPHRLTARVTPPHQASRFVPVVGMLLGLVAAAVYWATAQIWNASIAVVLSLLAIMLLTLTRDASRPGLGPLFWMFVLFIKYNGLMALSAAHVPFPLPAYCSLGLIFIVAQAASRGLVVSVMAVDRDSAPIFFEPPHITTTDLVIALALGLAPAALLGIPGLIGLVIAIVIRLGLTPWVLGRFFLAPRERLEVVQQLTEVGFYLGALASWKYV
jgi:adenosylcobinamide-GDP ribazoletransferase